ncbi:MAG: hypothetical protein NW220_10930 [Leptolyngbyaceae cyanobacterium bins.349]|nr:hypothetical protein [Leptolyngbyaceae cyanobacterium bins.349]
MTMTPDEIEAALQQAFAQCDRAAAALTDQQQQILRQALGVDQETNPLAQLSLDERQALLTFIQQETAQNRSWKMTLLNDWLQGRDSGIVQFIRDRYGIQWLEQIRTSHLVDYADYEDGAAFQLKVGDRIEVCNGLWEWVQDNGPCSREWFPCVVVRVQAQTEPGSGARYHASCVVRFKSGAEYEIQGIYEWNRPNWRWLDC